MVFVIFGDGLVWCYVVWGILGVLSSMNQYNKVLVKGFRCFLYERNLKWVLKWFSIWYKEVWWWFGVVLYGFGVVWGVDHVDRINKSVSKVIVWHNVCPFFKVMFDSCFCLVSDASFGINSLLPWNTKMLVIWRLMTVFWPCIDVSA